MINLAPPKDCTACHACVNVCPQHAVSMTLDSEGFLQPVINRDVCIGCGLCQKKCPALNRNDEQPSGQPLKPLYFAPESPQKPSVHILSSEAKGSMPRGLECTIKIQRILNSDNQVKFIRVITSTGIRTNNTNSHMSLGGFLLISHKMLFVLFACLRFSS